MKLFTYVILIDSLLSIYTLSHTDNLELNPLPHTDVFNTFANRADSYQAALVRAP